MDFNNGPSTLDNTIPNIVPNQETLQYPSIVPNLIVNEEHQTSSNFNQGDNDESENSEKKKIRRRSKNDTEGRTYICKICGKSYLSYPALYTHGRQKHGTNNSSGRGRGRPKKDTGELNLERQKFNPLDLTYFQKENRKGTTNDFDKVITDAFNLIYGSNDEEKTKFEKRNTKRKLKNYTKIEDHPFLNKFLKDAHDVNTVITDENTKTDNVLIYYLTKISLHVCPEYFTKVVVFVTLFREYVNIAYQDKVEGKEYTAEMNAEDVPNICNEFIIDFLDPDNGNDYNYPKEEAIDLTLNLCQWMYDNNFSCSKLTMINDK